MKHLLNRIRDIYNEYPRAFWVYNIIIFIDRLGGFMLYPFFALYLTQKYDIGMSTVGIIFAIFSVSGFVGSALGGALTDRRRSHRGASLRRVAWQVQPTLRVVTAGRSRGAGTGSMSVETHQAVLLGAPELEPEAAAHVSERK